MSKVLVLGGGGLIGVAWETGVVAGLLRGGCDVREAALIVGTSAGSLVGAQLALGRDPEMMLASQLDHSAPTTPGGEPDVAALGQIFGMWGSAEMMTEELAAEIGGLAVAAKTPAEAEFVEALAGFLQTDEWPGQFVATAVDCETGALQAWERADDVPLTRGVASSCAVPGLFPSIGIVGRRFMDGGVRSGTNADLALRAGVPSTLLIAPISAANAGIGAISQRAIDREVAVIEAAGGSVGVVLPGKAELEAFGPNLMDAQRRRAAAEAGLARGQAIAAAVAAEWV